MYNAPFGYFDSGSKPSGEEPETKGDAAIIIEFKVYDEAEEDMALRFKGKKY